MCNDCSYLNICFIISNSKKLYNIDMGFYIKEVEI